MAVVYAAHTESCTLMLDENGVCEWVAPRGAGKAPEKIIGAQFVASLDVSVPGALVGTPKEGVPMLFASADENGHISLIRTTVLERFDDRRSDSGIVRTGSHPSKIFTPTPFKTLRPALGDLAPRGRAGESGPVAKHDSTPPPSARNNYAPPKFAKR